MTRVPLDNSPGNPTPASPVAKVVGSVQLDDKPAKKSKPRGMSPTQRTLRELKHQGRLAAITEKWNQFAGPHGVRNDLFGFVDVLALDSERGFVAVQCCARSGHAAHRRKIIEECTEAAIEWLRCGGCIELWSWAKQKLVRGKPAERWMPKIEEIRLQDVYRVSAAEAAAQEAQTPAWSGTVQSLRHGTFAVTREEMAALKDGATLKQALGDRFEAATQAKEDSP